MSSALLVDQYSLTMSQFYWQREMNDRVSFELFVRSLPKTRGYLIAAGLGTALWHLRNWHFTQEDMDFLRSQRAGDKPLYDPAFLDFLRDLDFTCDLWAIREGTPIGAQVPIVRVTGPRIEATLVESLLLSIINHQTMIASKAARVVQAAGRRQVWDFSLRRLHGPEASLGVARAAYIAGAAGSATVEAGRILKIPTTGTMAHAQIMAFGEEHEQEVFQMVMRAFPETHSLLVDTYDTGRGIFRAICAAIQVKIPLNALRIDSDLEDMAVLADAYLNSAAAVGKSSEATGPSGTPLFNNTKILASNDLDEHAIMRLRDLPVDGYGVGTMLGTSADAPHLGGVYKLVRQYHREPEMVMKLTEGKQTDPGVHQVWRILRDGRLQTDVLDLADTHLAGVRGSLEAQPLLNRVMRAGRIIRPQPTLEESREYCAFRLRELPGELLDLDHPKPWPLVRTTRLWQARAALGDTEATRFLEENP